VNQRKLTVGIDASRNRSGGARAHLAGILSALDRDAHHIGRVHLWAPIDLLKSIADQPWLEKHNPPELESSLATQLWWQWSKLRDALNSTNCEILFSTDSSTLCDFSPMVVLSQDMLSYEPGVIRQFGLSYDRLRLNAIYYLQNRSFRRAQGVIFLTRYSGGVIQESCGPLDNVVIVPHGVDTSFREIEPGLTWPKDGERPVRCLYVSNVAPYKHQWHVVRAIAKLRQRGLHVTLELVGGGYGRAQRRLEREIAAVDSSHTFVTQHEFLPHEDMPSLMASSDIFVFASGCENMPVTLVEGMAVGLPIASSNRGPMPEVLSDGGVYFDPENVDSIADAIEELITHEVKRTTLAARAKELSSQYSWARCADETFSFITQTADQFKRVQAPLLTASKPYQICTKLVMDTSDPTIQFDADGICSHYHDFHRNVKPWWIAGPEGRRNLEREVATIMEAGRGREFDCIMGLSGGADSSYMLHMMVSEFGLRPLVFHVDGGWNSEVAVHNINVLVDKLGLDLYTEVIDWDEMRDFQLAMFKSGVPHIDIPQDMAFIGVLYKFAAKHGIRHILNGGNISTECVQVPLEVLYWGTDMAQVKDILSQFGTVPMRTYPFSSILYHKLYLRYVKRVKVVRPLNFISYVKKDAMALLQREYAWKPYPQKHFESRFTRFVEGYWLPTRFGFDMRRAQLSSLILTGQMTREEALHELERPPYDPEQIDQDMEFICAKLGITRDQLNAYHALPKKYYWDYRNQRRMFAAGEWVLSRLMGARRGGAF
jgi:N-acetyl sugar amidotransferase